jgi:PHD/YefM family antitoxin component YafN of YafNO toxin-antitoxin module
MAPQREHELPNGDRVIVIDTQSASRYLGKMLERFRHGDNEPLIFSDTGKPEGVVISFDDWLEFRDLRDEAAADERIRNVTSERLRDAKPEDWIPLEDLGWDLDAEGPPENTGSHG